eukprot:14075806-Ditylum_brightwellii.AAC.1
MGFDIVWLKWNKLEAIVPIKWTTSRWWLDGSMEWLKELIKLGINLVLDKERQKIVATDIKTIDPVLHLSCDAIHKGGTLALGKIGHRLFTIEIFDAFKLTLAKKSDEVVDQRPLI